MSTADDNRFWDEYAGKLRDWALLRPLTPEEAEAEAESAPSAPLSEEEIRRIVSAATRCKPVDPCETDPEHDDGFGWLDEVDTESVEEGVLQLNRNKGDGSEESDPTEEELRRRMLDDEEDEGGVDDGAGPPRQRGPGG